MSLVTMFSYKKSLKLGEISIPFRYGYFNLASNLLKLQTRICIYNKLFLNINKYFIQKLRNKIQKIVYIWEIAISYVKTSIGDKWMQTMEITRIHILME